MTFRAKDEVRYLGASEGRKLNAGGLEKQMFRN